MKKKKSVKLIQSQTKYLHRPDLEILRGNSLCPILLKISQFENEGTFSEYGEFDGDYITGIGQIRRNCYLKNLISKKLCKHNNFFLHTSEYGEFDGDYISGIGQIRRNCYLKN